ncbi:MAG TPA: radical SAM family heme chaperone HemW [Opitutaceae bacterium]|nr:radical SAM family heme chaperone HemW [Opitutaceae bacterium]
MSDFTPAQEKASAAGQPLGLYVHVPFCASTCEYCAFYQIPPTAKTMAMFLAGVAGEAGLVAWPRPVTTVFWGGGTPGLLAPRDLLKLGEIVRARLGGAAVEWTVELAPSSVTEARLVALREVGVTRVSIGVQSLQPALLEALGRRHTRAQALRAYERARAAGFPSVNLDLIFAVPGQDEAAWRADLREAVALAPDHISTYCLTFEEDTALWVKLSRGQVKRDVDTEARFYELTSDELAAAGYVQFEISNFARPGHACQHNVNTWRMHEWIGLGPGAASQHDGWRGANIADLEKWRAQADNGVRMTEQRVRLTPALLAEDALIFGLRMNEGVNLPALRARWPDAPWTIAEALVERLVADGLADFAGGTLRLTSHGRLLADAVGAEILEKLSEPAPA